MLAWAAVTMRARDLEVLGLATRLLEGPDCSHYWVLAHAPGEPMLAPEVLVAGVVVDTTREVELRVLCRWCGMATPVDVTCESCGSPMEALIRCRYCAKLGLERVCPSCQEVLIRLWRIAQESPDSRFLFADVL